MLAVFQSGGTTPWLKEALKRVVKMSAISAAQSFRNWPGILSGPIALCGSIFSRSFLIPGLVTSMSGMVGILSELTSGAWTGGEGFEKN